jgi:3-hydroxyisobutyrate dehydrogenase-like beta-hydroxyacid dehydrogenase
MLWYNLERERVAGNLSPEGYPNMAVNIVAILSPGDMGHAVGRALGEHGLDVITCLEGRSERTRGLARQAGIRGVGSLRDLVSEADLILSIVVPAQAADVARNIADALRATEAATAFADCNAVSPQTAEIMNDIIARAGGRFIDGSIIGPPPGRGAPTRVYVSGADAGMMTELDGKGIDVRNLGGAVGRASGIKMCYAALTKGTSALYTAVLTAAELLGLSAELRAEFAGSQTQAYEALETQVTGLPAKAFRWIGEMEEIASTFDQVGVTPHIHRGAADVFRLLSKTPLALETPETIDRQRTAAETISVVAQSVVPRAH